MAFETGIVFLLTVLNLFNVKIVLGSDLKCATDDEDLDISTNQGWQMKTTAG